MPYGTPTRFANGVTNSSPFPTNALGNYRAPLPMGVPVFFDDFMTYNASNYTVTAVGGASALASAAGNGGLLTLTTGANLSDLIALQTTAASSAIVAGNQAWFACRFRLNTSATLPRAMFGMANTFAALAPSEGIYFNKASGAAAITLDINGPSATTSIPIATTLVADTWYSAAWYYDGRPDPKLYIYFSQVLGSVVPQFGDPGDGPFPGGALVASAWSGGTYTLANVPTANMVIGGGILASTAVARTATLDYIFGAAEAVRQ